MDAFLDFVMPFEGDAYELITAFGLTYSFIVLVAFFILTVMHRIKDDWPINKHNSLFWLVLCNAASTYIASQCWALGIIAQIFLLIMALWDNNCKTVISTKIYDDFGISSLNEQTQELQRAMYNLMNDEQKAEWQKQYGKAAYKISNYKLVLAVLFPSSLVIIGCFALNNIWF